ncbi:unnamed protein product [Psylliodes chrysocephalus]|uniref:Putative inorganic phosphate cotransporter n=1 Tax=Psylliodes chrysocephalus TaxID=3402493 RepID=A0A9P0GC45_9CUCU|nr:unnamed protein product [Psylliodes chrysocephala]
MEVIDKGPRIGKRHVQVFLMFALLSIAFGMRVQLNVAMVAMTEKDTSPNPDVPVFDWNNKSVLLSSFYWGYLWLQILAGNLGRVYGTKYFLLVAMTLNSIICCTIPIIVKTWGSYGLMAIRVLQGLSQGFFYPSINDVLSKWSPSSERASLGNLAFSGAYFGTIFTMPLVAFISTTWYGWPLSFYIYGCMGFLWTIGFYFFGASSPASHRFISVEEKEYIESNLDTEGQKAKIPWKKMIWNAPFFAVYFAQIGQFFSALVLLLETPTYLNKVMKFDIESNGFLSAVPYIVSIIVMIVCGYIGDYLINHDILPIIWSRKLFTTIGSVIPAAAILTLGFCSEDAITLSVVMLVLASGTATACGAGSNINHIDLSPNFAGVLLGIINSSGTLVSILGPLAVQFIVTDETDKNQWKIIFIITAAVYLVPWVLFSFFASAEVQAYDASTESTEKKKERLKKHSVISVLSL